MKTKSQAHENITTFVHEVGIPKQLHLDNAPELTKGEMKKKMNKYKIYNTQTEPHTPKQNYAEDSFRIIKSYARYFMQLTDTLIRLFLYALLYACELRNLTASNNVSTKGRTPFKIVHGNSPDIFEYTTFLMVSNNLVLESNQRTKTTFRKMVRSIKSYWIRTHILCSYYEGRGNCKINSDFVKNRRTVFGIN